MVKGSQGILAKLSLFLQRSRVVELQPIFL